MMKDPEIIAALGGHHKVAEKLGVSREAALHWTKRHIPWKWRPAIKALAKQKRVPIPADFLETPRAA